MERGPVKSAVKAESGQRDRLRNGRVDMLAVVSLSERCYAPGSGSPTWIEAIPMARHTRIKKANEYRPRLTLLISVWTDSRGPSPRAFSESASSLNVTPLRTISARRMRRASSANGSGSRPVLRWSGTDGSG